MSTRGCMGEQAHQRMALRCQVDIYELFESLQVLSVQFDVIVTRAFDP